MTENLQGKKILLTGATSDIGISIATQLTMMGAKLILLARSEQKKNIVVHAAPELANQQWVLANLDSANSIDELFDSIRDKFPLDGLVNCIGCHAFTSVKVARRESYERLMHVNFQIGMDLLRNFCQKKVANVATSSSVVFILSVAASKPAVLLTGYSAAKAAMKAALKSAALEFASKKIRINSISPGWIDTSSVNSLHECFTEEDIARRKLAYPLGVGKPSDVANAVVFLLSDQARWITGVDLILDGGYSLR